MKKLAMGMSVLAGFLVLSLAPAAHANNPAKSLVTGYITENGNPVEDAKVEVDCNGDKQSDMTDASGAYLVQFPADDCPVGTQVWLTAKKGSMSGSGTADIQARSTKLNTAVMNLAIPEYGVIGGIVAAGLGLGAIAFTRRRLGQGQGIV